MDKYVDIFTEKLTGRPVSHFSSSKESLEFTVVMNKNQGQLTKILEPRGTASVVRFAHSLQVIR